MPYNTVFANKAILNQRGSFFGRVFAIKLTGNKTMIPKKGFKEYHFKIMITLKIVCNRSTMSKK